jgi:hypothetical protein
MRIGVKEVSPEGIPGYKYYPYLNGELVEHCVEADSDEGWVRVYDTDEEGNISVTTGGWLQPSFRFGKVELRFDKK